MHLVCVEVEDEEVTMGVEDEMGVVDVVVEWGEMGLGHADVTDEASVDVERGEEACVGEPCAQVQEEEAGGVCGALQPWGAGR